LSADGSDPILNFLNAVIAAFMAGGEKAAEAYITALDPALFGIPFVQWFVDFGVERLGQVMSVAGQKFVDGIVQDIVVKGEKSDVITAASALAFAKASGQQASIDEAVHNLAKAYKAAINFDGWGVTK
jgi:hypothetical protein